MPILNYADFFLAIHDSNFNLITFVIHTNFISDDFNLFANVIETRAGHPRIFHDGYSYGIRKKTKSERNNLITRWVCTGNSQHNKRCCASLVSKMDKGYMMMRIIKTVHTCIPKNRFQ